MTDQNLKEKPPTQSDEVTDENLVWQMMRNTANDNPIPLQVWLKWIIFWTLVIGIAVGWYFWE